MAAGPNDPVVEQPAPAATPASAPAPSPEIAAPVQADLAAATTAPAAELPPSAAGAEPPAKPEEPAREPTLLEQFDAKKAEESKPAEKPAEKPADVAKPDDSGKKPEETGKIPDAAKPVEAAPVVEPVAVDYFKDVKIPETIALADNERKDVTGALDLLRSGKTSEGVQKLFDLHAQTMSQYAEGLRKEQWDTFNDTRKNWVTRVKADPILGGAGHQTAMGTIARMRDLALSSDKPGTEAYTAHKKEFDEFLAVTGAGDHPAFLRMLHNFGRYFDEPALPPDNPRPPSSGPGRPAGESRKARMYPSMTDAQR